MGGAIAEGNITPAAEFNVWADPEAAARVFASGLDVTMIGLDVTHRALFTAAHGDRLRATGAVGAFVAELVAFFHRFHAGRTAGTARRSTTPSPSRMSSGPAWSRRPQRHVAVETASELCRGRTVVDLWRRTGLRAERARRRRDRRRGLPRPPRRTALGLCLNRACALASPATNPIRPSVSRASSATRSRSSRSRVTARSTLGERLLGSRPERREPPNGALEERPRPGPLAARRCGPAEQKIDRRSKRDDPGLPRVRLHPCHQLLRAVPLPLGREHFRPCLQELTQVVPVRGAGRERLVRPGPCRVEVAA